VDNDHLEFLLARDGIPSALAEVDQLVVPQIPSEDGGYMDDDFI
jgi:hypothetical protein